MDEQSASGGRARGSRPAPLRLLPSSTRSNDSLQHAPLFDFRSVWRLLRRRLGLIILSIAFCVGVTVFLTSLQPATYSASTRILLDEQNVNPFGNDEIFSDLRLTNPVVESQMQVMRSPYLLSQVVSGLGLDTNDVFMTPPITPTQAWLNSISEAILPTNSGTDVPPSSAERFQAAVERLRSDLRVSRNAQTLVIRLDFSSTDRALAAEVVNAVANAYINNRQDIRSDTATRASEWFDERISELNSRALEAEQQIERLSGGGEQALSASQFAGDLQSARGALQAAMAAMAQTQTEVVRLRAIIDSERGLRGVPSIMAVGTLGTLTDEARSLRTELAEALQSTTSTTEEIDALRSRIESLEAAGITLFTSMMEAAEARAADAQAAREAAQATFTAARTAGGGNVTNAIEVELRTLEGEARIYRELHESYLESYLRTIQQQSFPSTEATIIDIALPPEFSDGPGLSRLGLLAVLIGATLGAGGAFILDASDGRIRTKSQLQRATGAPVLGILPLNDERVAKSSGGRNVPVRLPAIRQPNRSRETGYEVIALPENRVVLSQDAPQLYAVITNPLSQYAGSIRRVSVEVDTAEALVYGDRPTTRITGFISDQDSLGRSIAAVNYAEMLAVGGSRTLLVDLDWTGIFLTEKITPTAKSGLADLLMPDDTTHSEQAFWYDERTSLYLLPNRSLADDVLLDPGVFDPMRLKQVLNAMSAEFDNIVLDISPMSRSSDAASLLDVVLGYVAVVDWGQTSSASLSAELLRAGIHPPKLLGTLLNGVSSKELSRYESAA